MTGIIERHIEAPYKVQDVQMGKVYRWCPESVVLKCECGEKLVLTASSSTICGECGAEHEGIVEEALDSRSGDEVYRPWRSRRPYYAPSRGIVRATEDMGLVEEFGTLDELWRRL